MFIYAQDAADMNSKDSSIHFFSRVVFVFLLK